MKTHIDPGIGQGRNEHHDPKANRDALKAVAMVLVVAIVGTLAVWLVRSWARGVPL
jgi:hypothetical protein